MLKKYKIIHLGLYVVKMKREPYSQKYGQCYGCEFDKNFACTQIYITGATRLCDVCSAYAYPCEWNPEPWKFIYRIETYAEKKVQN